MDSPVAVRDPGPAAPGSRDSQALKPEAVFQNVSHAYSDGKRPALHDVSFTLSEGETLGVVGPSGAGKSTLVWLLLRFFDPQQGQVMLGGRNVREIPL